MSKDTGLLASVLDQRQWLREARWVTTNLNMCLAIIVLSLLPHGADCTT